MAPWIRSLINRNRVLLILIAVLLVLAGTATPFVVSRLAQKATAEVATSQTFRDNNITMKAPVQMTIGESAPVEVIAELSTFEVLGFFTPDLVAPNFAITPVNVDDAQRKAHWSWIAVPRFAGSQALSV